MARLFRGVRGRGFVALLGWGLGLIGGGEASGQLNFEGPPIDYLKGEVDNAVSRLQERLDASDAALEYDRKFGYLPSVLEHLGISEASQVLVFSKTSFQHSRISPRSPRALYFNEEVYLGWVRGGDVLEITAVDPRQGAVFYLLDQSRAAQPRFERQTHDCLSCHASTRTENVPGHLVRSVYPAPDGRPVYNAGSFLTDATSPLDERWGGWYVSGTHGDQRHMGNVVVRDRSNPERLDLEAGANVVDLSDHFDASAYRTPHSDIVALMVLEHQTQVQNRITAAGFETRLALESQRVMNEALERPAGTRSDSTRRRIASAAERLVEALLFVDEAELTAPIAGTSGFTKVYEAGGRTDSQGRSLRELDLKRRLLRYPCSDLIHSEPFRQLPEPVREIVFQRLKAILTGRDQSPEFAHLNREDRRAILEILRETLDDPPEGW